MGEQRHIEILGFLYLIFFFCSQLGVRFLLRGLRFCLDGFELLTVVLLVFGLRVQLGPFGELCASLREVELLRMHRRVSFEIPVGTTIIRSGVAKRQSTVTMYTLVVVHIIVILGCGNPMVGRPKGVSSVHRRMLGIVMVVRVPVA